MINNISIMIVILLIVVGLCFGSFINAFVWRFHEHIDWSKKRSECDYCRHVLSAFDLIPVFSWLALRGKCRYCHKALSWQYPLAELITAAIFCLSYIYWPFSLSGLGLFQFICWLVLIVGFVGLTIYDLRWRTLPNKFVFSITFLALAQLLVVSLVQGSVKHFIGGVIGAAVIAGIFYIIFQISDGKWIGGGDVKLGICLGLIVGGPINAVLLIFIASLSGTLMAIPLLLRYKTVKIHIPFGPFLMFATMVIFLFGNDFLSWYKHLII
jgi:prepilin signal peptidase PulO-like enzyme (type II secretory pathway)